MCMYVVCASIAPDCDAILIHTRGARLDTDGGQTPLSGREQASSSYHLAEGVAVQSPHTVGGFDGSVDGSVDGSRGGLLISPSRWGREANFL